MKDTLIAFYIILCVGIIGCSFLVYSFMYALFLLFVFIFMYSDIFNQNRSNVTVFLIALLKLCLFLLGGYLYVENVPVYNLMGFDFRFPLLVFFSRSIILCVRFAFFVTPKEKMSSQIFDLKKVTLDLRSLWRNGITFCGFQNFQNEHSSYNVQYNASSQ
jgi:hypothetical protein